MTGAASRRKGNEYERKVARYLRDRGFEGQSTTRNALGHGGTKQPGDVYVDGPIGCSIECKNVRKTDYPKWLRQARDQAGAAVPVLVRKMYGVDDIGRHVTILPLSDYLEKLDGIPPVVRVMSATCRADDWIVTHKHLQWDRPDGTSWVVTTFAEFCRAARTSA